MIKAMADAGVSYALQLSSDIVRVKLQLTASGSRSIGKVRARLCSIVAPRLLDKSSIERYK